MATISMCDRCDAVGLANVIGTLVFHGSPNGRTTKLELCPECVGEIVKWIDTPVNRGGQPAFRKSYDEIRAEAEMETRELESGNAE